MNALRKRATAVILKDGKILLIKRVKPGQEYYTFPGGGVEAGESFEDAVRREVKEELCLDVGKCRPLFSIENVKVPYCDPPSIPENGTNSIFLLKRTPVSRRSAGLRRESMSAENQYHIAWLSMEEFGKFPNIFPQEGVREIKKLLKNF